MSAGRVEKCFMAHRNLCETLEKVDFFKLKNVFLEGEIDMWPGTDVTAVLVKISSGVCLSGKAC
ncbi:MAG: hypothetical protein V8S95_02235 [Odoribacter sp.]